MEVQTVKVNSLHCTATELSSLKASASAPVSPKVTLKKNISNNDVSEATLIEHLNNDQNTQEDFDSHNRDCHSLASSTYELEKEYNEKLQNLHGSLIGNVRVEKSNGSLNGDSSSTSATPGNKTIEGGVMMSSASAMASLTIVPAVQVKKRISNGRTPTRKAHRIKFYRNGDRFYPGITIPVSNERYRSFDSLFEDLTRLLEESVKIPGAVRTIYNMSGKKINNLDELADGQSYVCSCNNEQFKKVEYNTTSQPLVNLTLANNSRSNNPRVAKSYRPASPLKNGSLASSNVPITVCADNRILSNTSRFVERDTVVHPRIVTLIRNGTKPRHIMRLLLNKRNSPSFEHVLTAITHVVRLDTGYVRKIFTLSGISVVQLADFFGPEDIFFAYGTERINAAEDFKLDADEQRAINVIRKTLKTAGTTCKGPKPKMPIKSKKAYLPLVDSEELNAAPAHNDHREAALLKSPILELDDLPADIRDSYILGPIIGDGNFAIVLKIIHRQTGHTYALKIIDKNKCKGKEHYIDAEVRVMKKLDHPNIISLIMNVDKHTNMYLVLEYVSGGDLFDAITHVTRFSESQTRIMIRHLASAMSYLHSMRIVHRDIKPENLLVELDEHGNVRELKLADFGLACEVNELLFAVCGTPTYVAPEILLEVGYGLKIDVWAAGIILYILLCGFPPFVAPDNQQEPLFDAIITGIYEFPDPYWTDVGDGVRDLIANMLQSDPNVRFTSEDILDHYWTMENDKNECRNSSR
ncbi:serine/threonine-protein kinase GG21441 [Drosophila biarmipes]|uniref:serine/threonine-protein kinase GG21441 n=1 Tax=Drosophila biarmipes TaxID=125945 RepID=UPI0007E7300D|nr:serine/threonine-protein kinase GG21441 [Drosophila biarmipes]XP_043947302.1 serine/threonine-protein kinase GG21441 [Drosophila biarmipes]XP_050745898.1 serine/threonine-protein kinase GG21441 [Drosophila biarmipes]XP_050745899.1 serine/threonine-protein kinase GG21441 [Drosophila biarmipes]XP_050745900.1 serine/threonine-protein kinase GG21441 [Drosophila biarmipes]